VTQNSPEALRNVVELIRCQRPTITSNFEQGGNLKIK
jgi:hypothetical protein